MRNLTKAGGVKTKSDRPLSLVGGNESKNLREVGIAHPVGP